MKTKSDLQNESPVIEAIEGKLPSLARVKEIMKEAEIDYTDNELTEILHFLSKVISITTAHYERIKQQEAKIISIKTNTTHETESHPLHPCEHRRAS